jgi:hypothetical protein
MENRQFSCFVQGIKAIHFRPLFQSKLLRKEQRITAGDHIAPSSRSTIR